MDILISTNEYGFPLFKFKKNKKNVGSISISFLNENNKKQGFNIMTWKAHTGYGRKIMKSLFDLLDEQNMINNNSLITGYLHPIGSKNENKNKDKNRLKRIYSQMGFIINENNFFEQKYKNIKLNNIIREPQTPSIHNR